MLLQFRDCLRLNDIHWKVTRFSSVIRLIFCLKDEQSKSRNRTIAPSILSQFVVIPTKTSKCSQERQLLMRRKWLWAKEQEVLITRSRSILTPSPWVALELLGAPSTAIPESTKQSSMRLPQCHHADVEDVQHGVRVETEEKACRRSKPACGVAMSDKRKPEIQKGMIMLRWATITQNTKPAY